MRARGSHRSSCQSAPTQPCPPSYHLQETQHGSVSIFFGQGSDQHQQQHRLREAEETRTGDGHQGAGVRASGGRTDGCQIGIPKATRPSSQHQTAVSPPITHKPFARPAHKHPPDRYVRRIIGEFAGARDGSLRHRHHYIKRACSAQRCTRCAHQLCVTHNVDAGAGHAANAHLRGLIKARAYSAPSKPFPRRRQ